MAATNKPNSLRRGATAIEYAVLIGLALLGATTAIMLAGQWTARTHEAHVQPAFSAQDSNSSHADRL